jgi:Fe-S-cluster-containing dehydrogenase component
VKILTTPHMERCIGCHSCALACARLVHKQLSWETAGIRIHSTGGLSSDFAAIRCLACEDPPCVAACPTGAMAQRKGGGVIHKEKLCIHCGECAAACPVDAVLQDRDGSIYVCIQCGQCVDYCPHDCLEMRDPATFEPGEVTA